VPPAKKSSSATTFPKAGLCFRSRKRYEANDSIEVAVPYYPGQPSVFVRARIVRVEELPALNLFRYGVSYI
jgi:hypothetical protein